MFSAYTNEAQCKSRNNGGMTYIWAVPYDATDVTKKECLVRLDQPDCKEAQYSRYFVLTASNFIQ